MKFLEVILPYLQIIISILLIIAIILQQRGAGLSGVFGGGGQSYYVRRGFEKILFVSTIILAVLYIITTFLGFIA